MAERNRLPETGMSFLRRWSRRKERVRRGEEPEPRDTEVGAGAEAEEDAAPGPGREESRTAGPLPDPEAIGEDGDVSAFLASGVDQDIQQRALRRLFHSPKFNVVDGLDVYNGDYRSFQSLGEVITAHLRHRAKVEADRAARRLGEAFSGEGDGSPGGSAPDPGSAGEAPDSPNPSENGDETRSG